MNRCTRSAAEGNASRDQNKAASSVVAMLAIKFVNTQKIDDAINAVSIRFAMLLLLLSITTSPNRKRTIIEKIKTMFASITIILREITEKGKTPDILVGGL